jgi:hypothetical protein
MVFLVFLTLFCCSDDEAAHVYRRLLRPGGMVHHLILCLRTKQIYDVSPAIAAGTGPALLFLLIKPQAPALWLSDAFIVSLPIFLLLMAFSRRCFK